MFSYSFVIRFEYALIEITEMKLVIKSLFFTNLMLKTVFIFIDDISY